MNLKDKLKGLNLSATPHFKPDPSLLLHPNIPKPLHGVAPREVLGRKWWDAERKAAYKKTERHCAACGVHQSYAILRQWLEAHETYDINYVKGTCKYLGAVALCHACHNYIHSGRLKAMLEKGEIYQAKYVMIIQYGDRVLLKAGLVKSAPYIGPMAEWAKWRLVIGRKKYKPKFKSYVEWEAHFND